MKPQRYWQKNLFHRSLQMRPLNVIRTFSNYCHRQNTVTFLSYWWETSTRIRQERLLLQKRRLHMSQRCSRIFVSMRTVNPLNVQTNIGLKHVFTFYQLYADSFVEKTWLKFRRTSKGITLDGINKLFLQDSKITFLVARESIVITSIRLHMTRLLSFIDHQKYLHSAYHRHVLYDD